MDTLRGEEQIWWQSHWVEEARLNNIMHIITSWLTMLVMICACYALVHINNRLP